MNSTHDLLRGAVLERVATVEPEDDCSLITTEEVAEIFGVHTSTVIRWHGQGLLKGILPRGARREGRRYRIADVAQFAEKMGVKDGGYTPQQLKTWYHSKSA